MQFLRLYHMSCFANGSKQYGINKIINAGSFINKREFHNSVYWAVVQEKNPKNL